MLYTRQALNQPGLNWIDLMLTVVVVGLDQTLPLSNILSSTPGQEIGLVKGSIGVRVHVSACVSAVSLKCRLPFPRFPPLMAPSPSLGLALPIPDDPKKRKTSGCSSSYQPFSFLRIAAAKHREKGVSREADKSMTQKPG